VRTANLRKGIHYLAMAAQELSRRGKSYEFRVLGEASRSVRQKRVCQTLTFVGRIPRDQLSAEFQQADLLVLPSIAEGSAAVTYEALGAGVPVITTRAAGSIVRDGVEGLIVAERDPLGLAEAIERIVECRKIREEMSIYARRRAAEYTWERYGTRLIHALSSFGSELALPKEYVSKTALATHHVQNPRSF
jgi:glycosyltransferase involved in cell wall biosynthesis